MGALRQSTFPLLVLLALLPGIFAGCGQTTKMDQERASILQLWEEYETARLARDGQKVVGCYSADILHYYDQVVLLAATGQRADFEKAPLSQAFMALRARIDIGAERLRVMKGRDLVAHNHSSPTSDPKNAQPLGPVSISGNRATAGDPLSKTNSAVRRFAKTQRLEG